MRILLLVESAGAGVGRHVIDLAEALSRVGHQTHVIYNSARTDAMFRARLEALDGHLEGSMGVAMHHWPHPSDIFVTTAIRRYTKKHGPFDVLHCHSTKAGFLGRLGVPRSAGTTVYTPHAPLTMSPHISRLAHLSVKTLELLLIRRTSAIIAVSEHEADHLRAVGIPPSKIRVVPNAVPAYTGGGHLRHLGRHRLAIPTGDVAIGFVGRLEQQKRVDVLLHAVSTLPREVMQRTWLVVIGDGSLGRELRTLSVALGISSRTIWAGEVEHAEAYMPAFDVFALASDYEALPYVLLEALSVGLPIVATRVCADAGLVESDRNGLAVAPGDVAGMSRAICALITDPALRSRMAQESIIVSQRFSLDAMVRRTIDVYSKALSKTSHGVSAQLPAHLSKV
ncbi:MAG: glycosyltransferase family 4 protein [Acidobacteria bacterium]|nr:glycosyltransferase family 4 protein [Acidobacteriota bacterium]